MQNGDYYATILIPSNFTQCLNSASTKDKQIATITYSPNQATNYLVTTNNWKCNKNNRNKFAS